MQVRLTQKVSWPLFLCMDVGVRDGNVDCVCSGVPGPRKKCRQDFVNIKKVPVVMVNTPPDGHHGTFYELYGGGYAVAVTKWLNWHLKGQVGDSALFLDTEYMHWKYPAWTVDRKNF